MARSKSRKGSAPARQARATSRKKTATVVTEDVAIAEEPKGLGLEEGVAIITALLLLIGLLFLDHELGSHYDAGFFF